MKVMTFAACPSKSVRFGADESQPKDKGFLGRLSPQRRAIASGFAQAAMGVVNRGTEKDRVELARKAGFKNPGKASWEQINKRLGEQALNDAASVVSNGLESAKKGVQTARENVEAGVAIARTLGGSLAERLKERLKK